MKKALAMMLALCMLLCMGMAAAENVVTDNALIGVWLLDEECEKSLLEDLAPLSSFFTVTMEFGGDGKCCLMVQSEQFGESDAQEANYVVTGNKMLLNAKLYEYVIENDTLTMKSDEETLVLTRVKEADVAPVAGEGGGLEIVQKNAHYIMNYSSPNEYVYAKVQNNGTEPVYLDDCTVKLLDENGEAFAWHDYGDAFVQNLEPGESTYLSVWMYDDVSQKPADYELTLQEDDEPLYTYRRFPVKVEWKAEKNFLDEDVISLYTTVTNDTEEVAYDLHLAMVLLDGEGNLLYIGEEMLYDTGLLPGSGVVVCHQVPDSFSAYYAENGLTPAAADAIAFTETFLE